ncbi:MAG: asparaginase domain-containing protein [archaeon]
MIKAEETVHFVITGGTIDSFYDGTKDTCMPHKRSMIPSFIQSLRLYHLADFTTVCMKDSRDLTQSDLKNLVKAIEESPHKKIIVTIGTYTMGDTGRFIAANLKRKDQTIILTGSMIPAHGITPSDAPFNLGFAFAKVLDLKAGVYVAMNGIIFSPEEIMKVINEGRFSSIFGERPNSR